jgi:hypothetical protein
MFGVLGREKCTCSTALRDFRYNNRVAKGTDNNLRAQKVLLGAKGKRLTYRPLIGKE